MKRLMVCLLMGVLFCGNTFAAGTATLTVEYVSSDSSGIPSAAELKWVVSGNSTGDVLTPTVTTTSTTDLILATVFKTARRIDRVIINPTGGTAPANNYDIEVRVNSSIASDLLGGLGDNCGNTTIKMDAPDTETNAYPLYMTETPVMYGTNLGVNSRTYTILMLLLEK
jgi:hypothetical protein